MSSLSLTVVPLADGPGLAVHYAEGPLRPFLLLHDAGRDSQTWHDIAVRLNQVGHAVAAIDLRDHGDSDPSVPRPVLDLTCAPDSYDETLDLDGAADDVAHLIETLDLRGKRAPIAVGHGLGGNIALSLAARRGGVAAVACVDGGWSRPRGGAGGATGGVEGATGGTDPRAWYPLVGVPTLLCAALPARGRADPARRGTTTRAAVATALHRLPRGSSRASWYSGTGHDLPTSSPGRLTEDLLKLAEHAEPGPADPRPRRPVPGNLPGYLPLLTGEVGDPEL